MNQILSTKEIKPKRTVSMHTIIMFFGISIIIFGLCLITTSSYAIYKSQKDKAEAASNAKPEINVTDNGDGTLTISASHNDGIQTIVYDWDGGEQVEIDGESMLTKEKTIEKPTTTSILNVIATATNGQSITLQKEYKVEETNDESDMQIIFSSEDPNVKITVTSTTEIAYITYKIDDDNEQSQEINATEGEVTVEVPEGTHTLKVIAVDVNNNTKSKTQTIQGVASEAKPTLEVTQDGENFIVKMSDETGLDKVEFTLNGQAYQASLGGVTETEFERPLKDGENSLNITVYNTNGASESKNVICTKSSDNEENN